MSSMNTDQALAEANEQKTGEFRLKEFELLRGEVGHRSQEQRAMERNVVILAAAIFSFLLSKDFSSSASVEPGLLAVGWLIPPVVALLALTRWLESLQMIRSLAIYLGQFEREVAGSHGGWETSLWSERSRRRLKFCSFGSICFWLMMTGAPSGVAAYRLQISPGSENSSISWMWVVVAIVASSGLALSLIYQAGLNATAAQSDDPKTRS